MARKFTNEDLASLCEERGFIFVERAPGKQRIVCKDKDGYLYDVNYTNLRKANPSRYGINNKYAVENIKRYLEINNINLEIVNEEEYKGQDKPLRFKTFDAEYSRIRYSTKLFASILNGTYEKNFRTHQDFVDELELILPNITVIGEFKNLSTFVKCKCNICGTVWDADPHSLLYSRDEYLGCPKCDLERRSNNLKKSHEEFEKEVDKLFPYYDVISEYRAAIEPIEIKCNKHSATFLITPHKLLLGQTACKDCELEKKHENSILPHSEFVEKQKYINPTLEFLTAYDGGLSNITAKCKVCGTIWESKAKIFSRGGIHCPVCSCNSYGEYLIANWLQENNIEFNSHKTFDGLYGLGDGLLSYDFYIKSLNCLIEFQGQQHEKPIKLFGGEERFHIQLEHDERKRNYARTNRIHLIEIWYDEIEELDNILRSCLNKICKIEGYDLYL